MNDLDFSQPYPSRRSPLLARNIVATSQPLAAQAGLRMLLAGGNAVDAALAAAITLPVVEPTGNGLGSDAFAIVWDGASLHGLNASGRSPAGWTPQRFAGRETMPTRGWDSVTVPGAVSAWAALSERFGKLPFERLFEPAIGYARDGFPVSPVIATQWAWAAETFAGQPDWAACFMPGGRAPRAGELFRSEAMARSLEAIAASRGETFYRGELAGRLVTHAREHGGALSLDDLARHRADWCGTVAAPYRGLELHEIPPNGQGLAACIALGILEHLDLADHTPDSPESLHLQIEAMKLALADIYAYVADPDAMPFPAARLLEPDYLASRAKLVDRREAQVPDYGVPSPGGTVYLNAADADGRMVSYIQSNYMGFGSGVVVPDTGISLQNRGAGFVLEPGHPNLVGPGKRPFHTIIPGFLMENGKPLMSFGVMGGPMQAQGHVQMTVRLRDYHQNPQAASDAPRWRVLGDNRVAVETALPLETVQALEARGHHISREPPETAFGFGGAQLILRMPDGHYCAGSDHRKDGQAVGF